MTRERPIIIDSDSIQAVLRGRKTQTRRVISLRNTVRFEDIKTNHNFDITGVANHSGIYWTFGLGWYIGGIRYYDAATIKCPYGIPGDRLWVRETWCYVGEVPGPEIIYKATTPDFKGWASPIYMPRWASRITLEILSVRVERVQEISDSDCYAEGIKSELSDVLGEPRIKYAELWDTLNAKRGYPWADNPWIWVIEFAVETTKWKS